MTTPNEIRNAIETINEKGGVARAKKLLQEYARSLEKVESAAWVQEGRHFYWAVGFFGWGTAEEDLYFCDANSAEEALYEAMENFKKGWWEPNTYENTSQAFVYDIVEHSTWTKESWKRDNSPAASTTSRSKHMKINDLTRDEVIQLIEDVHGYGLVVTDPDEVNDRLADLGF